MSFPGQGSPTQSPVLNLGYTLKSAGSGGQFFKNPAVWAPTPRNSDLMGLGWGWDMSALMILDAQPQLKPTGFSGTERIVGIPKMLFVSLSVADLSSWLHFDTAWYVVGAQSYVLPGFLVNIWWVSEWMNNWNLTKAYRRLAKAEVSMDGSS